MSPADPAFTDQRARDARLCEDRVLCSQCGDWSDELDGDYVCPDCRGLCEFCHEAECLCEES